MKKRVLLSVVTATLATAAIFGLTCTYSKTLQCNPSGIADFYALNIRSSLFSGLLTVGSFLLSLKVFIVVKLKENVFDSAAYKERLAEQRKLNPDLSHYGPVKRLSSLLFLSIVSALGAAVSQLTIGLIKAWPAALIAIFAAVFAGTMLICTLWLIRQILDNWLSYFES